MCHFINKSLLNEYQLMVRTKLKKKLDVKTIIWSRKKCWECNKQL